MFKVILADVPENFRNMCLEIYELDPTHSLTAADLAWQTALKKTKVRLDLLADINLLLMVEKGIRGGICHIDMQKLITHIWKIMIKTRAMSQKLPINNFEWIEDISEFDESFIKNYNEESDEVYFLEGDVQYPESLHNLHNDLPFLPERMKIKKLKNL